MRKSISRFFVRLAKLFGEEEVQEVILPKPEQQQEIEQELTHKTGKIEAPPPIIEEKKQTKKDKEKARRKKPIEGDVVTTDLRDIRDMMEIMESPYLSISKNRRTPMHYERKTSDGIVKIKVSCHPPYYIASIYDWDIMIFIESKMQEIMNSKSDIPPRTLIVPRYELLEAIHKHNGKKEEKDIKSSLTRLQTTLIETNVRNEDGKYDAGFGWLDSWGYTDRKDIKEFRITISQWMYDGICQKGSLLKVRPEYFKITSGIKKFLYRTARKHVGNQNKSWDFLIETLYEKSGSEREFKKFKHDLKKSVSDNDIPAYFMKWIEKDGKTYVRFTNKEKEIAKMISDDKKTRKIQ